MIEHSSSETNNSNMSWIEIYITGRSGFRDEVRKRLESSSIKFMPGSTGSTTHGLDPHVLYWVDRKTNLRAFKHAIGSRLIWRYRLRFYTSLEKFVAAQNNKRKTPEYTVENDALLSELQEALAR